MDKGAWRALPPPASHSALVLRALRSHMPVTIGSNVACAAVLLCHGRPTNN